MMTMIRMLNQPRKHIDKKHGIPTWLLEMEEGTAPTKVTWVAHGEFLS